MNHPGKVFLTLTAALLLLCPQIFAQEPSGEAAPPQGCIQAESAA